MTLRAYARHRGINHSSVCKALARGRIAALRREGQSIIVDSDDADRRWAQAQERAQQQSEDQQRRHGEAGRAFASARAIRETYRAKLRQLEHDVQTGKLVARDDVAVSAFNSARAARDAALGIADRVAPQVPGRSLEEIRALLREEVERVIEIFERV